MWAMTDVRAAVSSYRYKNDSEIVAMTNLVAAYQRRDIHDAQKILRENKATILDDPFIKFYIDDVLRSLRTQYLIDLIKPYTRMELKWLGRQLNVGTDEVEDLLVNLILDGKVKGKIDQVAGRLDLDRGSVMTPFLVLLGRQPHYVSPRRECQSASCTC